MLQCDSGFNNWKYQLKTSKTLKQREGSARWLALSQQGIANPKQR